MIVNGYRISPGADLRGADLTGADLSRAKLKGADLTGADLEEVDLYGADLSGATLRNVHLSAAYLADADLIGADLTGADLRGTDLEDADLTGADLTGADLRNTNITPEQIKSADGSRVGKTTKIGKALKKVIPDFLEEISFRVDTKVKETPKNRVRIIARLDQLSSDVASLAGISKEKTPAKTILAAIEASNLTPQIMELVSDAVLDCADME